MRTMTSTRAARLAALALCSLLIALTGCDDSAAGNHDSVGGDDTTRDTGVGSDVGNGDTHDDDTAGDDDTGDGADTHAGDATPGDTDDDATAAPVSLQVSPMTATLDIELGQTGVTSSFALEGVYDDGTTRALTAERWRVTPETLGTITGAGLFTASGTSGGEVTVTAEYGGLTASARLAINLSQTTVDGGLDPSTTPGLFPPNGAVDTDPGLATSLIYPQDGTVFPAGIVPPEIQWEAGGHDRFLLELSRAGAVTLRVYTAADRHPVTAAQWRALADGGDETEPVTVRLWARTGDDPAAPSYEAVPVDLEIAQTSLSGTIYYSTTGAGDGTDGTEGVWRIPEGATSSTKLLSATAEPTCHGCHTLSRDGSLLAYSFADSGVGGGRTLGVADLRPLAAGGEPTVQRYEGDPVDGHWFAFGPDGSRLLVTDGAGSLDLFSLDPAALTVAHDQQVAANGQEPTWSPDGGLIAYVESLATDGDGSINFTDSNLVTRTFATDPATGEPVLGAAQALVTGGGLATTYPSFSPDSQWLAYSQGTLGRIKKFGSSDIYTNQLYLVAPDGSQAPIALDTAALELGQSGLPYDSNPSFSPFIGAGYYWLLFRSLRPYGHYTDFDDVNHTYRHQLWVMAVSIDDLNNGIDPSRPAFWLPGQATETHNMTAYWAPNPCHGAGTGCSVSSDCCGGLVCSANGLCEVPSSECTQQGNSCESSAECCPGLSCATNSAGEQVCLQIFN